MRRIFILGAPDPEMVEIAAVLREHGELVAYATVAGERVHAGNAYRMDLPYRLDVDQVVFIECGMADGQSADWLADVKLMVCDHHRPGNPGYGKPPAEFLAASSIGQVFSLLGVPLVPECSVCGTSDIRYVDTTASGGWCPYCNGAEEFSLLGPTQQQLFVAAADHCLGAAYEGRCPGVDPDQLMHWRIETRAVFQKRPTEEVLADVERARLALKSAAHICQCQQCGWIGQPYLGCPNCAEPGLLTGWVADLRGQHIPELPEAAVREGIPFLSTVRDRDGREKVVIQATSAWMVDLFLRGLLVSGLTDLYGDPARGFAGGYLPAKKEKI